MIDFHCHLDLFENPQEVARQCQERGLYVLSVTTTPSAWAGTKRLAEGAERIRTAIGLHPELAHTRKHEFDLLEEILPETRYVGEIGLDGTKAHRPYWSSQVEVFELILQACKGVGGRFMSIHSRGATGAVLDVLENNKEAGVPVLHWFSGSSRELRRAVDLGCWFSVGPAMLRGQKGQDLVAKMPQERVLTETDGPFVKVEERPMFPWEVSVAEVDLQRIWRVSGESVEEILRANLMRLLTTL
ncbi:MAG: TatD family hydrolase [Candidatus Hydrogenedentes bacterium]|nr:TatD family hydrolase [Candidatus Hydrogenedentota bacterium]